MGANHARTCFGFGYGRDVGGCCAVAVPAAVIARFKADTAACLGYQGSRCQKDTGADGAGAIWGVR